MVKKAVCYFLASGPLLLIGIIAINSRLYYSTWEFTEYGPDTNARIAAYAQPVRAVRSSLSPLSPVTEENVRAVADLWLQGYDQGKLRDIPPATTINNCATTVYQQILDSRMTVLEGLIRSADEKRAANKPHDAAMLYADALKVANIAKYSELTSVADSSVVQMESLKKLMIVEPQLDEADRKEVLGCLLTLDADSSRNLSKVVDRIAFAYQGDLRRQHKAPTGLVAAMDSGTLASAEDELQSKISAWERLSRNDEELTPLYGRSRLAYIQLARYQRKVQEAIELFSKGRTKLS